MKASILEKLDRLKERYEEVSALLSEAEIINNQNKFRELSKEYAELEPVVHTKATCSCLLTSKKPSSFSLKATQI